MFPEVSEIKKAAKTIAYNNIVLSFVISAVILSTFFITELVCGLLLDVFGMMIAVVVELLLFTFAVFPLFLGAVRYYSQSVEGIKENISEIFFYFGSKSQFIRAVRFVLNSYIVILAWGFMVMLIPICLWALSKPELYEFLNLKTPLWAPIFSTVSSFAMIIGTFLLLFYILNYYLSVYLFVCNDEMDVKKAFKISLSVSRRTKIDFIYLVASMMGYILISLPILPLIFTLPLLLSVYVVHGKCAVIQYNNAIDNMKKDYTVVAK